MNSETHSKSFLTAVETETLKHRQTDRQTDKGREAESDTRQRQSEDVGESEVSLGDPWPAASISGASQAEH